MAERGRSGKRNFHPRNRGGGGTSRQNSTSSNQSSASGNSGSSQVLYPSSSTLTTTTLFTFPPPNYGSLVAGYTQAPQQNNFLPFQNQTQLPSHGNFGNQQRVNQTLDNSHRGNWAGRARGNFQRGGQHGNQYGNQSNTQVGSQQEHQIGNQAGNPFGNQLGNQACIPFGNQTGVLFGNQGANQRGNQGGNHRGNQRGNQGGNQRGNQGGNQRGNQGGNQRGNQGGNQRGNQGGNQRGNQGGNQRGNQGGNQGGNHRGNQGGNQRGNQGGNQRGNRGGNYQYTRQRENTQQASIDTPKSGIARFFSGVMSALDGVVTAVAQVDTSPSRKVAQPRYRKQNQNIVHRVPTPETNQQQQQAKAGGSRRRKTRQVSQWKRKKQQQQQHKNQSKNPNSGQGESNLLSFMRSSSLIASTTELNKDDSDSDSDDSVYSTSSGYSTITNASEKRNDEIDELSLMGYEVIGDCNTPVGSWLNDQNEDTNKSRISISEPLEFSDGVVGVFWDIENCAVPNGKSAHDIVKKIRNTFYKGRKEEIFLVVCDIKNVSEIIVNELNNFQVKVEHVSSKSKNAADQKLKNSLIEFAMYDKPRGSCVVLITGDCDFASEIHTLRFKKNIHVILLHHKTSRKELVDTASETYLYEEFVGVEKYLVLMENIPEGNTLRTVLPLLVSPYQGRIEYPKSDPNQLLLIFPNEDKANELLNLLESGRTLSDGIKIKRQPKIRTSEINLAKSPSKQKSIKKDSKTSVEIPVVSEQIQRSENNSKNIKELLQAIKEEKSKVIQGQTVGIAPVLEIDPTTLNEEKSRNRRKKKGNSQQPDETTGTEEQVTQPMKHLCKIILESSQNENKDFWVAYLELHLDKHSFADLELEGNKVILQIESLALAKRLKRKLEKLAQNADQGFKVLSLIKNADESSKVQNSSVMMKQEKIIASLAEISKNVTQFMKKHENQIRHKDSELQALIRMEKVESSANMDNFRKLHDIRRTTQAKKDELVKQRVVFEEHLERKVKEIEALNLTLEQEEFDSKLREAMKDFGRECSAFKEALPIYAYKNYIIQVINKNKVCVLLAETGSGKSTQVTQYLCQAGYSQNGVIICTQPRKIAARSLAQHVSSQYGCKPGSDVSYQLNQKFDQGKHQKIVYSTDHSLLNECIKNPQLVGYSCIIIDEAHERSIFTDILLGMLKKILMKRNDLKLIITSATIDPKIFSDFFEVKSESVLNIPGRTYPIEIIWGKKTVKANYDYMDESVSKVVEIHSEEQPGHILSFLPTPAETQKACDMFEVRMKSSPESYGTFVCLPLHGKLSAEDQNKVFAPSGNKRKVIFATNCAETSITIPGIKYVVDCGLEKALHYDPIKQSSSLLIGFVSKSSADQRKGRAGRTEAGKCYRLFSIENYNNMASETKPEILRVNLGQALLKLMDLGVNDPCQFQFVQSPPIEALCVAMASLERLGATENGTKLTALGLKMSKIPVEPRLAKLVIRGQEEGVGYESLIVAALSSVSGIIFFRVEDNQAVADANKVTFSQEEGDFHTFLQVFMEWQNVPVKSKGSWCSKYCINGKSMKIADETVRELAQVFEGDLNIQLNQTFSEDANAMQILQYLIFEAFSDNLSVFSGQRNLGYFTYKDKEQVHIHPSSALNYLGHITPTFIIFDTKMTTSRNFILNIVPVNDVLISLGYQTGIISGNQIEEMKAMMFKRVSIGPFGKNALQHITGPKGKNKRLLEENLRKLINQNSLSVEISFDSGLVEVFSHSEESTIIKNVVNSNINEILNTLKKEQRQLGDKLNDCRYVLGPGMVVNTLLMPGEYRKIRIKNFVEGSVDSIISDLKSFGEVRSFRKLKREILVTMETSKMASSVVSHFSKLPFEPGNKIIVVPDGDYNRKDQNRPMYRVKVGWCRRPSSGYGFLNFDTALNYQIGLTELLSRGHVLYQGKDLKFKMTKNQTQDSIHVSGLPAYATEEDLKTAIRTNFPHLIDMIKGVSVIRSKEFTTTDEQLKDLERQLADLFSRYTKRENLIIDILQPRPKSMEYRAWVFFHNASDGDMAVRSLQSIGYKIPAADNTEFTLNLEAEIHSSILCRRDLYTFMSDKIKSVLSGFENAKNSGDKLSVEAKEVPGTDMVRLEILSNNLREMEILFNNYTEIFKGFVLDCKRKPTLEKLLTDYGNKFLQELARRNGCKVYCDFRQKKVSIHSLSDASLTKSQIEINTYLNKIEGEASKEIYLIGNHIPKGFLKLLLRHFGTDLEELVAQCSLTHVELDLRRHIITMHGKESAIENGEKALKVMMEACTQHSQLEGDDASAGDTEICPICFCPPEDPYRLEVCGHSYCNGCIMSQLNTKEIPVVCCKEGCQEALLMSDMKTLLENDENLDLALQEASLEYLVLKNPNLYSFCPTPDCPVVYKKSVDNSDVDRLFECPKCSVKICRRCQVIEHIGMDCDFYQLYKDNKDFSIRKWIAMNPENRKICPKCQIGIEKNGGCNHMTCRSCSTHMCWRCLKTFPTGQEVYNHQPFCLGATL